MTIDLLQRRFGRRTSRLGWFSSLAILAVVALVASVWPARAMQLANAADAQSALPPAARGAKFFFEVIESHDAKYPGDTPAHTGKDGGLTVRPRVSLGDSVYRAIETSSQVVGTITQVTWDRVSGSLTVEFGPKADVAVAVGDEVWIDLNPATAGTAP